MIDPGKRALIVEDDPQIAELIAIHIKDMNFDPTVIHDGYEAYKHVMDHKYDLILLDLMLPKVDGLELCRQIRGAGNTPIIMITAKSEEIDKVLGLESGADDYITKPFSVRELQARIKSVMRRSSISATSELNKGDVLDFNDLKIDINKRTVVKLGERVDLTPKEFDLLSLLASNPGKSFNRPQLLNKVWGYDFEGFEHTVNSHINRLRVKIEDDMTKPKYIMTTWGYGYRFNEQI